MAGAAVACSLDFDGLFVGGTGAGGGSAGAPPCEPGQTEPLHVGGDTIPACAAEGGCTECAPEGHPGLETFACGMCGDVCSTTMSDLSCGAANRRASGCGLGTDCTVTCATDDCFMACLGCTRAAFDCNGDDCDVLCQDTADCRMVFSNQSNATATCTSCVGTATADSSVADFTVYCTNGELNIAADNEQAVRLMDFADCNAIVTVGGSASTFDGTCTGSSCDVACDAAQSCDLTCVASSCTLRCLDGMNCALLCDGSAGTECGVVENRTVKSCGPCP